MASLNKVLFIGNLTRDPELKYTPGGKAVCEFGMAVNTKWSGGEDTYFCECQIWEKRAEVIAEYFHKGDPIFVEGRLKREEWTGKDGTKKSKTRVLVHNFEFIGSKGSSSGGATRPTEPAPVDEPDDDIEI